MYSKFLNLNKKRPYSGSRWQQDQNRQLKLSFKRLQSQEHEKYLGVGGLHWASNQNHVKFLQGKRKKKQSRENHGPTNYHNFHRAGAFSFLFLKECGLLTFFLFQNRVCFVSFAQYSIWSGTSIRWTNSVTWLSHVGQWSTMIMHIIFSCATGIGLWFSRNIIAYLTRIFQQQFRSHFPVGNFGNG